MTAPWLSIVGIGEDGLDGLSATARSLVDRADALAGGERHLAMIPEDGRERLVWESPMSRSLDRLLGMRGRRVCVLATGDPMHCGIGATLARRLPVEEMTVVPGPSAFALVCARMGWPRDEVETLSIHGRPVSALHSYVQPGARFAVLTGDGEGPAAIARLLRERGFGSSRLAVFERMGGTAERRIDAVAGEWNAGPIDSLNSVAVECIPGPDACILPRTPGLPDEAFRHDGQMTKREVRAVTIAALVPGPGQRLWDVGAGCGSVAIEWLRAEPTGRAVAIERNPDRVARVQDNAVALGTPRLEIVAGEAPRALGGLDPPDAVFVGGGVSREGLLEACWEALRPGGRLVANAVTLDSERRLMDWHAIHGGDMRRLAVSRLGAMGTVEGWRALAPVTQLATVKP